MRRGNPSWLPNIVTIIIILVMTTYLYTPGEHRVIGAIVVIRATTRVCPYDWFNPHTTRSEGLHPSLSYCALSGLLLVLSFRRASPFAVLLRPFRADMGYVLEEQWVVKNVLAKGAKENARQDRPVWLSALCISLCVRAGHWILAIGRWQTK